MLVCCLNKAIKKEEVFELVCFLMSMTKLLGMLKLITVQNRNPPVCFVYMFEPLDRA